MLAGLSPFVSHALVALAALGTVMVASALAVLHQMRKRWRALRARAGLRAGLAWFAALRGQRANGPARWRFELWDAVSLATRAVRAAERASGGPLGDLRSLNRRLRGAAEELDGLLAIAEGMVPEVPEVQAVRGQVDEALAAASAIRRAALASAANATSMRTGELAEDAGREVESVLAGVTRVRAVRSGN